MANGIRFATTEEGEQFWTVLRARAQQYFDESGKSRYADALMVAKSVFYFALYLVPYAFILFGDLSRPAMLVLAGLTGLGIAGVGFNIAHDAAHDAYSSRPWLNRLMAHSFTLLGVHVYNWRITHNILHHAYTNIPYGDGDLHPVPWLRYFDIDRKRRWYHKYQHLYALPLYALASLTWILYKDFKHLSQPVHVSYRKKAPPKIEYALCIGAKLLHYTLFLVVPLLVLDLKVWEVLLGFFVMHAVAGLSLAGVFATGHVVEGCAFPAADDDGVVQDGWAAHQLRTSYNFGTKNWFYFWTVGGLNYQIEHHLFPRVCHVHYPALQPIVKQTAAEFGLPYREFSGFVEGIGAHLKHLRSEGRRSNESPAAPAFHINAAK